MFFSELLACKKKPEILPLATALIACLRNQFNHAFALLIFMPARFKSINYYQNRPKIKLSRQRKLQNLRALGAPLPNSEITPPLLIFGYAPELQ